MSLYLDHNSTTPVDDVVLQKMLPYFSEKFGNASSSTHLHGWAAANAVDEARSQVANGINAIDQQITFTSGSTEAINLAMKGVYALYHKPKGNHIITCKTEHKAVLDVCAFLEKQGAEVTYLNVDSNGLIDLDELASAMSEKTIMVSIMYANNETGVIQDVQEIGKIVHNHNSIFMSDATQAIGKLHVDVQRDGIDILCCSAHKFYGPKGIGAIYTRRKGPRVALQAQIHGGGHQRNLRSGTLNVAGIVGMGQAMSLMSANVDDYQSKNEKLIAKLESELATLTSIKINGGKSHRLSNTTNISFQGIPASRIIELVKGRLSVSTGSACTSAVMEPSHVLKSMGVSDDDSYSSIRFSLGKNTSEEDIDEVIEVFTERLKELK